MSQPTITYSLTWQQYNIFNALSGKTYVNPNNGKTVDCSYVDINYSCSVPFKKFYATAVEDGKNYGFIDDVLVDINGTKPTGVKLHEQSNGAANTNYTFRLNSSSLAIGEGLHKAYRIGLYAQQNDGTWNYEYFFLTTESNSEHKNVQLSDSSILQVPVIT